MPLFVTLMVGVEPAPGGRVKGVSDGEVGVAPRAAHGGPDGRSAAEGGV